VRRMLLIGAVVAAVLAGGVEPAAAATSECRGFMTCVPVAGPWVVVPVSRQMPRPQVQYQLTCPRGFIVGGLDAELTDPAIDVWFLGAPGSPVAPGRTTSRTVVFVAMYVGTGATPPTFRPHAGCVPASGGGGRRTPTALTTVVPPGHPTVRRVRTFRITAPRVVAVGCRRDEHLVAAYSATGFRTAKPPSASLVASLSARPALALSHLAVDARGGGGRGVVQVSAVCAGGR
jgi:hypothetical protein